MALFNKKDKKKELEKAAMKERERKLREISDIIKKKKLVLPTKIKRKKGLELKPHQYREFLEEVKDEPKSLYEKSCKTAEKIIPLKVTGKMKEIGASKY